MLFACLSVALHGRCSVDRVAVETVAWHFMSHHTRHNHSRVDPCNNNNRVVV